MLLSFDIMNKTYAISIISIAQLMFFSFAYGQQSLDDIDRIKWMSRVPSEKIRTYEMTTVDTSSVVHHSPDRTLPLNGEWTLSGLDLSSKPITIDYSVPGSVHSALYRAGIIPDPVVGKNDSIAEKYSYKSWKVSRTFYYDGSMTDPLLSFQGVANKCRVYINGKLVGSHEGMFSGPNLPVAKYLRVGENKINVELDPIPEIYNGGWPATANEAWKFTVVANCVYGWHYAKIPTIGIWNDVCLIDRPRYRIEHPFFVTLNTEGEMQLKLTSPKKMSGQVRMIVRPYNFVGKAQAFVAEVKNEQGTYALDFKVSNPHLWWPNDVGRPDLYDAEIQFLQDGKICSCLTTRFGIRTVEMKPFPQGKDSALYNWTFCVNGRDMFVKGAGWCLPDVMMDLSPVRYNRFLSAAQHQHIQMLRAWGGGLPEKDIFYNLCDEKGIMVFQEWPTAWNSHVTQPYKMLEETVVLNTLRLRNHPSLVMWGGGNESNKPYGKAIDMMGINSLLMDGTRPFHRTEQWGGSLHNYNCWWDDMHLNWNLNMTAPFWGEFGLPSLPNTVSVTKYLNGESFMWPPKNVSVFTHHTPIFGTNGEIGKLGQYSGYFVDPDSLDKIVIGSQLAQVVGSRYTIERARTLWPKTTGVLYYKLNDNYPGLSWSSVDYYGVPKPLHYFVRRAYAPATTVLLFHSTNLTGQDVSLPFYFLDDNGKYAGKKMMAHLSVWNHKMNCVMDTIVHFITSEKVLKLADIHLNHQQTLSEMLYFKTDLLTDDSIRVARNWYFSNYETRRNVIFESKGANVKATVNGDSIMLTNLSSCPAIGVTVNSDTAYSDILLDDNYLWLDPGESLPIGYTSGIARPTITWWNKK